MEDELIMKLDERIDRLEESLTEKLENRINVMEDRLTHKLDTEKTYMKDQLKDALLLILEKLAELTHLNQTKDGESVDMTSRSSQDGNVNLSDIVDALTGIRAGSLADMFNSAPAISGLPKHDDITAIASTNQLKVLPAPSSDVTNVVMSTDVSKKYEVIVKVDKFNDCVRFAGTGGWRDVYSSPVRIPQWSSWVSGLVSVGRDGSVQIFFLHHTGRNVDVHCHSPQNQDLSLQTSVMSSTTMQVLEVLKEEARGTHLKGNKGCYTFGVPFDPKRRGWLVDDTLVVKFSLSI